MNLATPHIVSELMSRPLLVTPDKLHAVMNVLNRKNSGHLDLDIAALAPYLGADRNDSATKAEARPVRQAQDGSEKMVAIIPMIGSLISRNRGFSDGSGLRSYRTIAFEIDRAMADRDVVGIVLDVDTYGGAAAGCARLARHIRAAAEQKPIYANIDLNCFSAGTWLASACTRVYLADEDAGMGSVGCLAIHRDISGKNEKDGEVYTLVYFGDQKVNFNSLEPLSANLKEKLQAGVTKTGMVFAEMVAQYRGLNVEDVIGWQAGCFYGADAIKVGLADGIASFSETIAMVAEDADANKRSGKTGLLTQRTQQSGRNKAAKDGDNPMTTKEQLQAILQEDDATSALLELGFIPVESAKKEQDKVLAGQKQSFSNAVDLAAISDLSVLQVKSVLLADDLSTKAVSAALQNVKAETGKKTFTSTTTPDSGDGKHGLLAAAEKLAAQA